MGQNRQKCAISDISLRMNALRLELASGIAMLPLRSNHDISGIARLMNAVATDDRRAEFVRLLEHVLESEDHQPTAVWTHENTPGRLPQTNDIHGPRGTNFSYSAAARFIFVLGGSYRVVRELDEREQDRIVRRGEFYWMRPESWNLIRNDVARSVLSVVFETDHTRFVWYHHKREPGPTRMRDAHISLRYHTYSPASEPLRQACSLMDAALGKSAPDIVIARSTARTLLGWCLDELRADEALSAAGSTPKSGLHARRSFDEICAYIAEHLQDELSREQVAEAFRMSEDHLTRLFRLHARCGFVEFVRAERFRLAERLLAGSRLSIKEVAAACGFNLSGYFIKRFRERHGITPNAWRRLSLERS